MRIKAKLSIVMIFIVSLMQAQYKYVGVKSCAHCHRGETKGMQYEIWQNSEHARAFKTLSTSKANKIAEAKKLKPPPAEAQECLVCHTITADAKLIPDGVQCESCHGAGSSYKAREIMRDHDRAVANGMVDFSAKGAIEKSCRECHNSKSPVKTEFNFEKMWEKIKHPIP